MCLIEVTQMSVNKIYDMQLRLRARGYGNFDITPIVNGRVKYLMVFEKVT